MSPPGEAEAGSGSPCGPERRFLPPSRAMPPDGVGDGPSEGPGSPGSRRLKVGLALASLYLIWGSTYLAIRIAIDTLPPFLMAGVRFLMAGGILVGWARSRGADRPGAGLWKTATVSGILMFLVGNGSVVWAEQFVPSGLVALIVATVPLWIVLQDWGFGRGGPPGPGVMFGILLGFSGVAILVSGSEIGRSGPEQLLGGVFVLIGAGCWAAGSLVARYGAHPPSAAMGNGMQMVAGGVSLLVLGLVTGEAASFDPSSFSLHSLAALLYLTVFGSLLGFSSYIWLLRNTTPAVASTYAYVNPVVALFLGWALAGEPLSVRTGLAAFVILSSVVLITARPVRGHVRRRGGSS
jgi:drug/metabolite transporter (DMT)-like permease